MRIANIAVSLLLVVPNVAQAQAVSFIDPAELTVTGNIDFTTLQPTDGQTVRNDIIDMEGASFGKRFAGMSIFRSGSVEGFSGAPTDPLTLQAGPSNQNLALANEGAGGFIVGVSSFSGGFPNVGAQGEGMISVMFDQLQSQIGFDRVGVDGQAGYSLVVDFWRADGSLIHRAVTTRSFTEAAFRRAGDVADIAGITIVNSDSGGLGYNNFRFAALDVGSAVPEPASWAMLVAGFGLAGAMARRQRRAGAVHSG